VGDGDEIIAQMSPKPSLKPPSPTTEAGPLMGGLNCTHNQWAKLGSSRGLFGVKGDSYRLKNRDPTVHV
jgi:hypothetical protein